MTGPDGIDSSHTAGSCGIVMTTAFVVVAIETVKMRTVTKPGSETPVVTSAQAVSCNHHDTLSLPSGAVYHVPLTT